MACVFFCLERKWGRMAQVFRVERNKNFTVMSNHHFKNKDLSLKAKGLLSLILSLPEDWNYLDNKSKMTQISQYELVLHKDNNWKIVGLNQKACFRIHYGQQA